jgi:hypothetical protein
MILIHRELRSVKSIMQSPLSSGFHLHAGECILAIEGDRPIHAVLQHIGISAWPGKLLNPICQIILSRIILRIH